MYACKCFERQNCNLCQMQTKVLEKRIHEGCWLNKKCKTKDFPKEYINKLYFLAFFFLKGLYFICYHTHYFIP